MYIEKEITLLEALTGVDFTLTHLDGRTIRIKNNDGEIVKPDSTMTCEGLGLPFHKTPYKNGNLFIKFTVKFPDQMNKVQMDAANSIFTSQQKSSAEQKALQNADEKITLQKFQDHHKNSHAQGGTRAYGSDEEEDDEDGQQNVRVGCPQQ